MAVLDVCVQVQYVLVQEQQHWAGKDQMLQFEYVLN